MSASVNTALVSRIGKGRLPGSGPGTAPELPAAATAVTPDAFKTARMADQAVMAPSQSLSSTATPAVATPDPAPIDQQQPSTQTSKWGKSSAAEGGPVFQVVSRGSRVATGSLTSYTPPSHPTKSHTTVPRTRSLALNRSTPSSSSSSASISLRRSISSNSSNGSAMAFGSKADRPTGRLLTDGAKGSPTPPAATNCKSVVRVLSYEETSHSPGVSPAVKKSGFAATRAAGNPAAVGAPTAPAEGLASAPAGTTVADGTNSTLPQPADLLHNRSSSNGPASWLSGEGCSSPLHDLEPCFSGRPTTAALRVGFGPLPDVHDAETAAAAAQLLLQQLLDSASSMTAAAGLSADSLNVTALSTATAADGVSNNEQSSATGSHSSLGADGSSGIQPGFDVLIAKAAVMLEAGVQAEDVRQAVLPALLLQLAGMACDHSNNSSSCSGESAPFAAAGQDATAVSEAGTAAAVLKASVKAGVVAAQASMMLPAASADTASSMATADLLAVKAPAANMPAVASSSKRLGMRVAGACLLLFGSMALLTIGFVFAIAWTILEGGSAWVNSSKGVSTVSGINQDGVDWPVEWLFNSRAGSNLWAGAVLPGRRFVP